MSKISILITFISLIITLIIGISLFLSGCHPILRPYCNDFIRKEVEIAKFNYTTEKCAYCENFIKTSEGDICIKFTYFNCYTPYIILKFDLNGTKYCNYKYISESFKDKNLAMKNAMENFLKNQTYGFYINSVTNKCKLGKEMEIMNIVGFSFLIISLILFILLIVFIVFSFMEWRKKKNSIREENNKMDNSKKIEREIKKKIKEKKLEKYKIESSKISTEPYNKSNIKEIYEIKPNIYKRP